MNLIIDVHYEEQWLPGTVLTQIDFVPFQQRIAYSRLYWI